MDKYALIKMFDQLVPNPERKQELLNQILQDYPDGEEPITP